MTTLLAVLLAGSLVQSLVAAASAWRAKAPASREAVGSLLEWSRRGNVLVLALDSLQADVLDDVLAAEPSFRQALDGFRHYRLASSNGPTTCLSLPTIHGGSTASCRTRFARRSCGAAAGRSPSRRGRPLSSTGP